MGLALLGIGWDSEGLWRGLWRGLGLAEGVPRRGVGGPRRV